MITWVSVLRGLWNEMKKVLRMFVPRASRRVRIVGCWIFVGHQLEMAVIVIY
jgi:hypothetical protein